jgi:hypothetical protein
LARVPPLAVKSINDAKEFSDDSVAVDEAEVVEEKFTNELKLLLVL